VPAAMVDRSMGDWAMEPPCCGGSLPTDYSH
jgi:hypothetical protein